MDAEAIKLNDLGITAIAIIETASAIPGHLIYHGSCISCGYETARYLNDKTAAVKASSRHKNC